MKPAAILTLTAITLLLLSLSPPSVQAQPEVTLIFPEDGAVLAEAPQNIHLCFAEPVDNADDADFRFRVFTPEDRGLGLRIVFQSDGLGVDVQPGLPETPLEGEWTFEWRVSDAVTREPASGTIHFQVRPDGTAIPTEPPQRCTGAEAGTPQAGASPAAASTADGEDGGPGTLVIVLIVVGAVAAAAAALILLTLTRRRIGAWLGRPPPSDDGEGPAA